MACAVLIPTDGETPLDVVDSGVTGGEEKGGGVRSQQECTDCEEWATPDYRKDTDFLRTEETLVAGETTGVLWLAMLASGWRGGGVCALTCVCRKGETLAGTALPLRE